MINMHLPAELLNFIVFFHAISCIKSLSRHRLLVAGIFGMNLKSYLEEHVVCGFLKSKHLPSFKYMSPFCLDSLSPGHVTTTLLFVFMQLAFWLTTAGIIVGAVVAFFIMYSYLRTRKIL